MPTDRSIQAFNDFFSKFSQTNFEFFYKEKFGELSLKKELEPIFNDVEDKLIKIKSIITLLNDSFLLNAVEKFDKFLKTLLTFSRGGDENFIKNRGQLLSTIQENYNEILGIWPAYAAIYVEFITKNLNTEDLRENFDSKTSYFSQEFEKLRADLEAYHKERFDLKSELEFLRRKSEEDAHQINILKNQLSDQLTTFQNRISPILKTGEILKQQEIFNKTATQNRKDSILWVSLIAFFAIIIILFTINLLINAVPNLSSLFNDKYLNSHTLYQKNLFFYYLIKKSLATIFILSILVLMLKFCIKNYNSLMHNHTVNIHKANSFAASLNLIHTAFDNEKKDEILNLAAKEIFSQQKTGYLSKDSSSIDLTQLEKVLGIVYKSK